MNKYFRDTEGKIGYGVMVIVHKQFKADPAEMVKVPMERLDR